ncbi:protoheme IX geranylgeranyltransferase [Natronomonas pharaonis DSM 2160]|uniref:Protoheme IX farnesyltransferase 2 n=1 Tax=Natronomonas pharaonis (strain ATCC 35678 / DSM 2160 / CIP 103997 / JCM 8858 / NBRC 14720 / NCIMB 2260 / Gabara) TaxID=348780 RepID=COXX2_NATPD|nr:heme o synthase [Natronomonas pharaonis]Q3INR7.1 RecName: Full=Protoheme IX farnesyltransferase 2; AltName: Full=Heme B farnesyltransferase 2; AltName: Full=Heme O synthase 2 [Natronomonas pharaonis DSM 2160]CAI50235.1 protoheme IX geranylgeranyltransferase [Natronomonas pharaonis DSM 2160]
MQRFTGLVTATTLATYLLVVLGVATELTGGVSPAAVAHYVTAGAVWLLLVAAAALAWRDSRLPRVKWGVTAAAVAYPAQAAVGMAVLASGGPGQLHLFGGVGVFALLLITLTWHLDREVEPRERAAATAFNREGDGDDSVLLYRLPDGLRRYVELTKPRLMWLLCLLALSGMALATVTGAALDGVTIAATLFGGVLAVGAAGTFNHVYERDRDRRMNRTADRPVATDAVGVGRATAFGVGLLVVSMAVLVWLVNPLAAALTAVAVVYYAVVYTVVLKPTTTWNTVIGGGAGALPAVIGWAAVAGSIGLPALLLAAVVFCWTPAHFYNLAIAYRDDYARGDYPMLPVVAGVAATRRRILYWLGATLLVAGALGAVAGFGPVYALTSAVVGFGFLWTVVVQFRTESDRDAYRSFHASNAYLGALLVAILVETMVI